MTSLQSEYALEDTNFPALRFKEFSDNWEDSKLGEICEFLQGVQVDLEFQISNQKEGYIKFLRIENYTQNSLDFRFIPINLSKNKFIDLDDIVVVRYGATAGFISRGHSGVLANNLFKIIPNENKLDKNYLFLLLKSDKVFKFFQLAMAGGAMPALSFKIVGVLPLSFPSLPEQTKVANFLTAVDEKITLLTQKADLLSQYKKGVMQQIFSQELRFKDDNGQEFPEWEEKTLGELYSITSSKRVFQNEWTKTGVPFYRAREVVKLSENGFVDNELFISTEMFLEYKTKYGVPQENDLIVTGVGTIGRMYVVKASDKFYFKDGNIIWFKVINNVADSQFIKQLFQSPIIKKQIEGNASITTVGTYTIDSAKKTLIPYPSLPEQTKIANFLTAIDDKITTNQTQLNAVKQYKQGLLQQMFV